ncbi:MAG: glycoside hydrolase family 95 protein [Bacteroidales bacterium]|nr:glycoside hydrolase family 95 protein [Candidatus Physcousia equi]
MRRILYLLLAVLCTCAVKAAGLPQVSTKENPVWYFIQFTSKNGVLEAPASAGEVKTAQANGKDVQLWRVEGNETDGFQFYSRSGLQMYLSNPDRNSGFLNAAATAPNDGNFDIVVSTVSGSNGYLIGPHGKTCYLNQWQGAGIGKRLGLWDADAGCVLNFVAEEDMDMSYQAAPSDVAEVSVTGRATAPEEPLTLWYKAPAKNWTTEALPIGNGEMGAMIFGGIRQDRIQFNHKTFWRGGSGSNNLGTYLNFGELYVINKTPKAATNYQRRLDIHNAVAEVEYTDATANYKREYLASNPDGVIAIRYTATTDQALNLELQFINTYGTRAKYSTTGATYSGKADNNLFYRAEMKMEQKGGNVTSDKDAIYVEGAKEVTIYLVCGTDYSTQLDSHMTSDEAGVTSKQQGLLSAAQTKGFDKIREDHSADHRSLFDRVDFQLKGGLNNFTTGELLQKTSNAASMKMVDMLVFQYGRYLTIASSRGVDLPSNLQGIWCKDGNATSGATWASDIHTNVNVQMNYWPAESTNLSECHAPLLNFLRNEALRANGGWVRNAKDLGINRGWVVNTASNIFGGSSAYKVKKYSCANAWLCSHLWQHFAYTRDFAFLKETAFPVMKSACEFWFDRLVPSATDEFLECPNEYSPEQGRVQNATAHSQQLVTQLFLDMQAAIEELGAEADCDDAFRNTLAEKLAKIDRGLRIDANGMIREWKYQENTPNKNADTDYFADDEANVWKGHRHTSHLMALYPHFEIDPGKDPDMFKAARVSLLDRGDKATGWARAWRISLWSRLRDAQRTYTTLRGFSARTTKTSYDWNGGLYDNLMDAHATSVFQIEGNFGATAGIAEMLLQSRPDSLVLMPALPKEWAEGYMHGLKAIGNFEVDIDWNEGKLTTLKIKSVAGRPITLAYPGLEGAEVLLCNADGEALETKVETTKDTNRLSFTTTEGQTYLVRWADITDGIKVPNAKTSAQSFHISGRNSASSDSGIIIQNGRKVLK